MKNRISIGTCRICLNGKVYALEGENEILLIRCEDCGKVYWKKRGFTLKEEATLTFKVEPETKEKLERQLLKFRNFAAMGKKFEYIGFSYSDSEFHIRFKVID